MVENTERTLTKEQYMFYIGKKKIEKLEKVGSENSLAEIKEIKEILWMSISKFAKSEINRMMGMYSTEDERCDVLQDCACKFFFKLPSYDPLRVTPTTFFVRYFREVIANHIRRNHIQLTQYDAANSRKVKAVINEYESKGIAWTSDMVATKTGLSQKVVKKTISFATNAKVANIDDTLSLISTMPTPEESLQEKENKRALYSSILKNTTPIERKILLMRVNLEGRKKMSYDKISEITGMSIREVKAVLNGAVCKLNQDQLLRTQFGERNIYHDISGIQMQEDVTDFIENDILNIFS